MSQGSVAPDGYAAVLGEPRRRDFLDLDTESSQNDFLAGVYLYLLRLNAPTINRTNPILEEALPLDLDPGATISMPIRASDKCTEEGLRITYRWRNFRRDPLECTWRSQN